MTQPKPYFMKNPKWYKFDDKKWKYGIDGRSAAESAQVIQEILRRIRDNVERININQSKKGYK